MLDSKIAKEAFDYFKVRYSDFLEIFKMCNIKPGPEHEPPTNPNYKEWKAVEWAGFLYKYVTPKK